MTAGIGAADAAIYTGICLENNDTTGRGRIKYCVPQLSGTESFGWAQPVVPGYTPVGSNVYVAFEGGDRNRPIFWHDQSLVTSYPTFATLEAIYPSGPSAFGATYWITDHGGSVQWQPTGSGGGEWQWLPNGLQASYAGTPTQINVSNAAAKLLTSVTFNNPSPHRVYHVTADTLLSSADTNLVSSGYALMVSSSTLPATYPTNTTFTYQIYGQAPANTSPSLWLTMSAQVTGLAAGPVNAGLYLVNYGGGTNHIVSAAAAPMNVLVTDVGATS